MKSPAPLPRQRLNEAALLELPVGDVSPVIRFENAYHIVMVVQRKDAGRVPFTEVQADIQKLLKDGRRMERAKAAFEKLKSEAVVKTIFDDEESNFPSALKNTSSLR